MSATANQTSLHLPGGVDHHWAFGIYGLLPHTDAPTLLLGQRLKEYDSEAMLHKIKRMVSDLCCFMQPFSILYLIMDHCSS